MNSIPPKVGGLGGRNSFNCVSPEHINHIISKEIVQLAVDFKCGVRLEDLSNIRQTTKQKALQKSDASSNRDYWSYFQLEQMILYKAQLAGVPVEKVPAAYTIRTYARTGDKTEQEASKLER